MLNTLYQIFLTVNATSLIVVVFLIKEQTKISFLGAYPNFISYFLYIFTPILLTGISLLITNFLSKDEILGDIKDIEQANNAFLPSYLGYFFVALSVPRNETLLYVFAVLFVFTYFSQTLYFNPLFLLFKYQFYYVTTKKGVKIFIISKKSIRSTEGLKFLFLRRINNFTYIDEGGK